MPNPTGPMACPVDGTTLTMSERSGIEIDYCPTCRGVWLDRGELDKIIERNAEASASPPPQQAHQPPPQQQQQQAPWGQPAYGQYGHKPHKRRKGFLEELFD
jgi:Zn-finger nucleic acid-binding protein